MAETNALLKRHTGNRIEGSNPSVSANSFNFCNEIKGLVRRQPGDLQLGQQRNPDGFAPLFLAGAPQGHATKRFPFATN